MSLQEACSNDIGRTARHWGAELCQAANDTDAGDVLNRACLELGFDGVSVLRYDAHGVSWCWSRMDGDTLLPDHPFLVAKREVMAPVDKWVHNWTARHPRVLSQVELLSLNPAAFGEYMQLPRAFGYAPWQTMLSIPFHGTDRGFRVGVAGGERLELYQDHMDEVRFLANLYCQLTLEDEPQGDADDGDDVSLTPHQISCLRWAAAGKSYEDIGAIMGITERGVRYHLNGARDRYGYATIMQTIVTAAKRYDFDPLDAR